MAVCDVLKRYEEENRIVVQRVAGSSAGAVAAVMLTSRKSIETYKAEIKSLGTSFLAGMQVSYCAGVYRLSNMRIRIHGLILVIYNIWLVRIIRVQRVLEKEVHPECSEEIVKEG
jgi:predicted acylesterase/phospholipase RssA